MTQRKKSIFTLFLAVYLAALLYVLFLQRLGRPTNPYTYLESLATNLNLIPFADIYAYLTAPVKPTVYTLMFLKNIVGNILMAIPAGFFLPLFIKKCRRFRPFLVSITIIIVIIELLQLVSTLGMCDIDDVILNLLGSIVGFKIWAAKPVQHLVED